MDERLAAILRSRWSALHALLYRLTLRPEAAEDLLQELFLKLSRSDGFAAAENPAAFAHRAAVNLALDWRRRHARERVSSPTADEPADQHSSPLQGMIDRERVEQILDALRYLPAMGREVIILRFVEDWRYEQIGAAIGKTAHQARAICHDAIVALRTRLKVDSARGVSHAKPG